MRKIILSVFLTAAMVAGYSVESKALSCATVAAGRTKAGLKKLGALETAQKVNDALDQTQRSPEASRVREKMKENLVGQDDAIEAFITTYQELLAGYNRPGHPLANLLLLGPTGTGKTRAVEVLAGAVLGNEKAVIKIDCAEYQHSHEIAKLIGSPPGYLGHRETHPLLSQEVINQYQTDTTKVSFVLFDEVEKASDSLWNLMLGIMDKATLTLGDNRKVDFSRTYVIMTGNIGEKEMQAVSGIKKMGFAIQVADPTGRIDATVGKKAEEARIAEARKKFTPEFLNRVDKIIVFKPLGNEELYQIVNLELGKLQQMIYTSGDGYGFYLSETAKEYILNDGLATDNARAKLRAIDKYVKAGLANLKGSGQLKPGDIIFVDLDEKDPSSPQFTFTRKFSGIPAVAVHQFTDSLYAPMNKPEAPATPK